ncbi:MAG: ATP-binding domain-containing protein, partial [Myxococcales bacterium]|nr:ATP-binding domain-containing protein [Myxococcales bacterium]
HGVAVVSYERWAAKLRERHFPHLPRAIEENTPSVVVRLKKHPVLLRLIDEEAEAISARVQAAVVEVSKETPGGARILRAFEESESLSPGARLSLLKRWLHEPEQRSLPLDARHPIERTVQKWLRIVRDIPTVWAELLTDQGRLEAAFTRFAPGDLSKKEIEWAHSHCARACEAVLSYREDQLGGVEKDETDPDPVDGEGDDDEDRAKLDLEDDGLLLRLYQRLVGPLRGKRGPLRYEHVFVDETQDLAPTELAVILGTVSAGMSVTLAGDVAQKLVMDNGFTTWREVLGHLGLDHVEAEPLELSYRSTHEILEFATEVLGPLRNEVRGKAIRGGAPVELFRFSSAGEAVGFLSEALRELVAAEPLATVAVIARHPEQADLYYTGLVHGEVPNLRRIARQDFPFRPGVDVTDVRQVKGLEFDYVVIVEASASSYPLGDEARHLMHIAATRAAHQLWVLTTGSPSAMIPEALRA